MAEMRGSLETAKNFTMQLYSLGWYRKLLGYRFIGHEGRTIGALARERMVP